MFAQPAFSIAKVGNGGDIVDVFLDEIRIALRDSAREPLLSDALASQCDHVPEPSERAGCRAFVLRAVPQLRQLLEHPPAFQLVFEPLVLQDGRPVQAGTECEAAAPVLFHYDSIKSMLPAQLFHLAAHELGHKVRNGQGGCVDDDSPQEGFASGRRLLDSFAAAWTAHAAERKLIQESFGIKDEFSCGIFYAGVPFQARSSFQVLRRFDDRANPSVYRTGPHEFVGSDTCVARDFRTGVTLAFRFRIHEAGGCRRDDVQARGVTAWIERRVPGSQAPEILKLVELRGRNPLCESDSGEPIALEVDGVGFCSEYLGSLGTMTGAP